ncbi:Uncharacterised protein [Mycobacterium tuberculosis]|nr:Uncharacterised protein [Mycobacterium tuberculosis]CKT10150.1 Uncharacterised protein [Mycobacterium tuberculosis]COY13941.1 Uncharacterised protein [Mycobacterium tuberculosis]
MIEQKAAFETTESGVPAQKPDAADRHVLGEIVLGEIDLVVRGDERHLRFASHAVVVQPLAWVPTGSRTPRGSRRQPDELSDDPGRGSTTSQFELSSLL